MENIDPTEATPDDEQNLQIPAFGRTAWIMFLSLLVVLALVSTLVAFFQAPGRNPFLHPQFPSLDWFLQPIEQNAELRLPAVSSHLNDVYVVPDTNHVWAVGDTGMILHSPDAGITWKRVPEEQSQKAAGSSPGDAQRISVGHFDIRMPDFLGKAYAADAPKQNIREIEKKGTETAIIKPVPVNQKSSPEQTTSNKQPSNQALKQSVDTGQGKLPSADQIVIGPYTREIPVDFYAVHFVDKNRGWAVGSAGAIVFTQDGGERWEIIQLNFPGPLFAVHIKDLLDDTAAGQRQYRRYPAPWYYLSLILLLSLFVWTLSRQPRKKWFKVAAHDEFILKKGVDGPLAAQAISVADEMVSDRPLGLDDPDPLDFKTIARGLSRFLRNKNTRPPLTIAVTGEWGSGKSTLMNMLREDLKK